ncbi:MAG: sulfite exporter TauE/SafE family protein [Spirochaetales bacterium]|nr:sulfite exporter TauE/SafE family protein [Spirochaetales bacterium]
MLVLIFFAFLAGIVTVLSPCILPVLPVVLSGSVGEGKSRPWGIITGFIISFSFFTLTLSTIVQWLGVSPDVLRWVAAVVVLIFGLIMVVPPLKMLFSQFVSRMLAKRKTSAKKDARQGFGSGLTLGISLGLVWTPCVGPIMASVITLSLTANVDFGSVIITIAYSLGTAIPLFLIMQGGRGLLKRFPFFTRHSEKIQKIFGILMIVTAITLVTGLDRRFQSFVLDIFPGYGQGLTAIENNQAVQEELKNLGESDKKNDGETDDLSYDSLSLGGNWFNSPELDPEDLKGKVVLIDFWTYSCINCIRTLPYLKAWDEKYRDKR